MLGDKIVSNSFNIFIRLHVTYVEINRISTYFLSKRTTSRISIASFGLQSISFSSDVFAPHTDILCVTHQPLISAI